MKLENYRHSLALLASEIGGPRDASYPPYGTESHAAALIAQADSLAAKIAGALWQPWCKAEAAELAAEARHLAAMARARIELGEGRCDGMLRRLQAAGFASLGRHFGGPEGWACIEGRVVYVDSWGGGFSLPKAGEISLAEHLARVAAWQSR